MFGNLEGEESSGWGGDKEERGGEWSLCLDVLKLSRGEGKRYSSPLYGCLQIKKGIWGNDKISYKLTIIPPFYLIFRNR